MSLNPKKRDFNALLQQPLHSSSHPLTQRPAVDMHGVDDIEGFLQEDIIFPSKYLVKFKYPHVLMASYHPNQRSNHNRVFAIAFLPPGCGSIKVKVIGEEKNTLRLKYLWPELYLDEEAILSLLSKQGQEANTNLRANLRKAITETSDHYAENEEDNNCCAFIEVLLPFSCYENNERIQLSYGDKMDNNHYTHRYVKIHLQRFADFQDNDEVEARPESQRNLFDTNDEDYDDNSFATSSPPSAAKNAPTTTPISKKQKTSSSSSSSAHKSKTM